MQSHVPNAPHVMCKQQQDSFFFIVCIRRDSYRTVLYFFLSYASEETRRLLQDMKTVLEKFVEKIFFPIGPVTFGP